jgi:hypothetical protein
MSSEGANETSDVLVIGCVALDQDSEVRHDEFFMKRKPRHLKSIPEEVLMSGSMPGKSSRRFQRSLSDASIWDSLRIQAG